MKKIILLIISIALISCAHAQKKNSDIDSTKFSYGVFDIEIPTEMLVKATVTSSDGPLIIFEDRRNISLNVIHSDDTLDGCTQNTITNSDFQIIKEKLEGHNLENAFTRIVEDLGCSVYDAPLNTYYDFSGDKLIYSRCREKDCETVAVYKNDNSSEQVLLLLSQGFDWKWIKEIIRGS